MAKNDSIIKLLGTIGGLTFVKSSTYGDHVRRARGTHKKAKLNPACKAQSRRLVKSNTPAKIILDAINPYRRADFYYGPLWQDLISMINHELETNARFDFSLLQPFELHPDYQLRKLVNIASKTKVDSRSSKLKVTLSYDMPPVFPYALRLDGFRVSVIAMFPDLETKSAKTEAVYSDVRGLKEDVKSHHVKFTIPPGAKRFLLFVRIDGFKKGKIDGSLGSIGMRMVEAGMVSV